VHWYYKLSDYDAWHGIVGHECINEIIADRLLTLLKIPHLSYQLLHAKVIIDEQEYITWLCRSEDFKKAGDSKIALDAYYQMEKVQGENPLEFCIRQGWAEYIYQMLIIDFLILNRDRHGANIEVLRNKKKKTVRLAPLFDHGLSLLCRCETPEAIDNYDVLADLPVQCYVGSRSTVENLKLIPADKRPSLTPLKEGDKAVLLEGLDDVIQRNLQEKIWEMIWKRWCYYEDFCHSGRG
jgi:hypothetical protein